MAQRTATNVIVVHCSATRPNADITAARIREWHLAKGWSDIGYALVIKRNGLLEFGRPFADIGAHVAGRNSDTVGICLAGGLYDDGREAEDDFDGLYTVAQKEGLRVALKFLMRVYPNAQVLGHRDLSPDLNHDGKIQRNEWLKTCPGFDVKSWLEVNL